MRNAESSGTRISVSNATLKGLKGALKMGTVLAVLKILPEDVDVELEKVKNKIVSNLPEKYKYHDSKIEPFAFGLNQLKISFTMEDSEGGTEPLEQFIKSIKGVGEVNVEHVSLI